MPKRNKAAQEDRLAFEPIDSAGLKSWLERTGTSRPHLAHLLGIKDATVLAWMAGRASVRPSLTPALRTLEAGFDVLDADSICRRKALTGETWHSVERRTGVSWAALMNIRKHRLQPKDNIPLLALTAWARGLPRIQEETESEK